MHGPVDGAGWEGAVVSISLARKMIIKNPILIIALNIALAIATSCARVIFTGQ